MPYGASLGTLVVGILLMATVSGRPAAPLPPAPQ